MENVVSSRESFLESAIAKFFTQVIDSGQIISIDHYYLVAMLLEQSLTSDESDLIKRLLYAVRRGRLKVVEDPSILGLGDI